VTGEAIPVYLGAECLRVCARMYPYLQPKEARENEAFNRRVANLGWNVIESGKAFELFDYPIFPFDVKHGEDLDSMAFAFGEDRGFVYISDVSRVPEAAMAMLRAIPRIRLLVVDALAETTYPTHFGIEDAVGLARALRPEKCLLVGMTCSLGLHEEVNERLRVMTRRDGIDVQLAYDGMVVPL